MLMDVHQRGNLRFPQSLPEFQRLFPDDAACAGYLEKARWSDGFVCPHCQAAGEPFRFANRPGVLRCRKCRRDTGLTVGTVMARSHTPLSVWFWSAYLVSSQTPGMSAVQLRRQLGLSRGSTLHVVGVGNNRIGKVRTFDAGGFRPSKGLKQGFFDGTLFYGEASSASSASHGPSRSPAARRRSGRLNQATRSYRYRPPSGPGPAFLVDTQESPPEERAGDQRPMVGALDG